jgi:diguanylate cyclase (GGDEF)-like protein
MVLRRLVERSLLEQTASVVTVGDAASARRHLERSTFDAIAVDISLPDAPGHAVIESARSHCPGAGIVAVTGHVGVETAVRAMQAGADDFLPKPFEVEVLWHVLDKAVASRRQRLEAEQAATYRKLAYTDALTGVPNRRYVEERLEAAVERARGDGTPLIVAYFDLDNFKLLNDVYGHTGGDRVLQGFARLLSGLVKPPAAFGRYGGDEFVALFPGGTFAEVAQLAGTVREKASRLVPDPVALRSIPNSVSAGIAAWSEGVMPRQLVAAAEAEMFLDKSGARSPASREAFPEGPRHAGRLQALRNLVRAVDRRDAYTRFHSDHATYLSLRTGRFIGLDDSILGAITVGGPIHDLGKIVVPDDVLRKPGPLTTHERETMEEHPLIGAAIAAAVTDSSAVVDLVRLHHERVDGRGYPEGLKGEAIPPHVRLFSLADAYSAMVTDRPYRRGLDWTAALEEVARGLGGQFDPDYGAAFLQVVEAEEGGRPRSVA